MDDEEEEDTAAGMPNIPHAFCVKCKGSRGLCGLSSCPLLEKVKEMSIPFASGKEIYGSSPPSVFIGHYGYPSVYAGPLVPPLLVPKAERLDSPEMWSGTGKTVDEIVALRSSLVRGRHRAYVRKAVNPDSILAATQELALAVKSVDTELKLKKPLQQHGTTYDLFSAPMGPSGSVESAKIVSNTVVPRKVDYLVNDTDVPSATALWELYRSDISVNHLQKILSVGVLGRKQRRVLVPTRWSITATDDTLGKKLIRRIASYSKIVSVELYETVFLGNRFRIILIPAIWAFDMVEIWLKGAFWGESSGFIEDYEFLEGRREYAFNITGAYYAARLAVLENLEKRQRQAAALVYREITDEYWAPLGVWVIREAARKALSAKPRIFASVSEAIAAAKAGTIRKDWAKNSVLLNELRVQRNLYEFEE
ncbi:MAG: Nre family DNA repair protein [Thermoplasmata archaeon]